MDRVAIISDIHGNITALKAVIKDIEEKNISKIFCLGDSVLKSCNSDKVIDLLKFTAIFRIIFAKTQNKELPRAWNI